MYTPSCLELECRWVLKPPHEGTALLFPIICWDCEANQEATVLDKIRWDTPNSFSLPDTGYPGSKHGSYTPRRLRMSSSTPGVRASLLWTCLSYLAHHPWLPPSFSFWKPEADHSPCMSCPWICTMHLPHCLLICVPVIWGEVPKSLSQRPLYIFLRLQAQPRSIICLEDALGSEWVWRGQCCWKLGFGGLWLEKMCVKSFGFLNITCGISQSPQIVKICEKSLTWSRQLKLLSFTQVSNPRDSKWKKSRIQN